uniref:Cytochrome P450 6PZ30 n=1 Tax=Maconellicoccus hirsutus TaxID=177089 RepID=A0AAT9UTJ8_MACHI
MYFNASVILVLVSLTLYVYWYLKKSFSFFKKLGIPHLKPSFLFGNITDVILMRKSMAEEYADLYKKLGPHKFAGVYVAKEPSILVRDPELLKNVLVKDFDCFNDRGFPVDSNAEPMTAYNLFFMKGDDWRNMRMKLTNTFTTGKMKMMFPLVNNCGKKFAQIIEKISSDGSFDAKEYATRFTNDIIGNCAFGLEIDTNNANSESKMSGKKLLEFRLATLTRILRVQIPAMLTKILNLTLMDLKTQNFFGDIIHETITQPEKNQVPQNDISDLMKNLRYNTIKKSQNIEDEKDLQKLLDQIGGEENETNLKATNEIMAAQSLHMVFFMAGYETASTNICYLLLELAQNPSIQEKVRNEINTVLSTNDGQLNYDDLKKMTYTDMVIDESLRKYPPLAVLFRRTSKNYKIPDTDIVLPADTPIAISSYGLHHDEKYYDNPEEFRPERFTEEEKAKRPSFAYLPFGQGPRSCIGARFAKLVVKVGLIHILNNFSYQVSPKMQFPIEFDKSLGLLTPSSGILLQREKIC